MTLLHPFRKLTLLVVLLAASLQVQGKMLIMEYARIITPHSMDKPRGSVCIWRAARATADTWLAGANLWKHLMAQNGYIVFTVDLRGSAGHSLAF